MYIWSNMGASDHSTFRDKSLLPSLHELPQGSSGDPSWPLSPTLDYVSLCGKIDSVAHLKCEANELSDKQCEQAKKVSGDYSLSVHVLTTSRTWLLHVRRVSNFVPP
jgi:hypothetical protein